MALHGHRDCGLDLSRFGLEAISRTPTGKDRQRHAAYVASDEALATFNKRTKTSLEEALVKYQKIIDAWNAAGERMEAAWCHNMAGSANIFLLEHAAAVKHFEQAV